MLLYEDRVELEGLADVDEALHYWVWFPDAERRHVDWEEI